MGIWKAYWQSGRRPSDRMSVLVQFRYFLLE